MFRKRDYIALVVINLSVLLPTIISRRPDPFSAAQLNPFATDKESRRSHFSRVRKESCTCCWTKSFILIISPTPALAEIRVQQIEKLLYMGRKNLYTYYIIVYSAVLSVMVCRMYFPLFCVLYLAGHQQKVWLDTCGNGEQRELASRQQQLVFVYGRLMDDETLYTTSGMLCA